VSLLGLFKSYEVGSMSVCTKLNDVTVLNLDESQAVTAEVRGNERRCATLRDGLLKSAV
jgi:hypothetical protein